MVEANFKADYSTIENVRNAERQLRGYCLEDKIKEVIASKFRRLCYLL